MSHNERAKYQFVRKLIPCVKIGLKMNRRANVNFTPLPHPLPSSSEASFASGTMASQLISFGSFLWSFIPPEDCFGFEGWLGVDWLD